MTAFQFFDIFIIGSISTEFIIDLHNRSHQNILGGSALYSAGGVRCWKDRIAVSSHTQLKNQKSLERIHDKYLIDFDGTSYHADSQDDRIFLGYVSPFEVITENPVAFYASKNITFPRDLIGYSKKESDDLLPNKPRFLPVDIPSRYWDITSALICHFDLFTQLQVSSMLQNRSTKTLVIQSSDQYMKMVNFDTMPVLMKDITTFITTEAQLCNLFRNRSKDIWEMAEHLCSLGCDHLVIDDGHLGQYLYDRRTKNRFHVPIYPVEVVDPTGMLESFCGGYIAGIKKSFDPLEALLHGSVSASFAAEGSGPFYGVDAISGLQHSRLKFARELVKII